MDDFGNIIAGCCEGGDDEMDGLELFDMDFYHSSGNRHSVARLIWFCVSRSEYSFSLDGRRLE